MRRPAAALAPGGVPDPRLNLLAEVTGAVPIVVFAALIVAVYGAGRLAAREPPGLEAVGLDDADTGDRSY